MLTPYDLNTSAYAWAPTSLQSMLCPLCCAGSQSWSMPPCQLLRKPTACRALPNFEFERTLTSTHAKPQYIGSPYWLPPVFSFHSSSIFCTAAFAAAVASAWIISTLTRSKVGVTVTVSSLNMFAPFVKFIYTVYVQNGVLSTP